MPVLNSDAGDDTTTGGIGPQGPSVTEQQPQGGVDTTQLFGDDLARSSVGRAIGTAEQVTRMTVSDNNVDPEFDGWKEAQKYPYLQQYPAVTSARNMTQFNIRKDAIDQERDYSQRVFNAGGKGTLIGLGAGALDPVNLIPVGGEAEALYKAESIGGKVANVGANAFHAAKAGLAIGTASTLIQQATNPTANPDDILPEIAGSTLLAGVLGGTIGAFKESVGVGSMLDGEGKTLNTMKEAADALAKEGKAYADNMAANDTAGETPEEAARSAGAAEVPKTTMEQETLVPANVVPNKLADMLPDAVSDKLDLTKSLSFNDPLLSLMNSPNIEARRTIQQLADIPADVIKNQQGIKSDIPAESEIKQWEGANVRAEIAANQLYDQYRFGRAAKSGEALATGLRDAMRGAPEGVLTRADFMHEIGGAMRRGDTHDIPEVAQAAKMYRSQIFDPLKEDAIKQGNLPSDVEPGTAVSYLSRLYNKNKIVQNRPEFERVLASWLKSGNDHVSERFDAYQNNAKLAEDIVAKQKARKAEIQQVLSDHIPVSRDSKLQAKILARELKVLAKQHEKIAARAAKTAARVKALTPSQVSDDFALALRDVKNGIPKSRQPSSLTDWVRSRGGLRDNGGEAGEVKAIGQRLVNNKSGHYLDDAAEAAVEEGYNIPREHREDAYSQRPSINEFLHALNEDASGRSKLFRDQDQDLVAHNDYIEQLREAIDKEGIDLNKLTPNQVENQLNSLVPGAADTIKNRAVARESEFHARRAEDAKAAIEAEIERRAARFEELRVRRATSDEKITVAQRELDDAQRIIDVNSKKAERFRAQAADVHYIAGRSDDELRDMGSDITDGILGLAPGRLPYDGVPVTRGPLKERTLTIPDKLIDKFLDNDITRVSRHYTHTMSTDLAISRRFGDATMQTAIDKINAEYDSKRLDVAAPYGVSSYNLEKELNIPPELSAELKALQKAQKRDIDNVTGVRDRLRGTYGMPTDARSASMRTYRVIKQANYLRGLGGMTLTALSHAAKIITIPRVLSTYGAGIKPLIENLPQFKLAASEARLANTALEMASNATFRAIGSLDDNWHELSKFERGMTGLSDNFRMVSLMAPYISGLKQITSVISQSRSMDMIGQLAKGGDIAPNEMARLLKYGIDVPMAKRINAMVNKYGKTESGIPWANTQAWTDKAAVETYRTALQREVDKIIVTPGQDIPLFMSRPLGQALLQFRSFAMASTQRTLISGLQQRDLAVLNGAMCAVGLGMLSYWAKTPSEKLSDKPSDWVAEGIDRGGMLAWFNDANNALEKVSGNRLGASMITGTGKNRPYDASNAASAVLGPTYGTIFSTLLPLVTDLSHGSVNQKDVHNLRSMLPYQNLFYIKKLFDAAESGINQAGNVPKSAGKP